MGEMGEGAAADENNTLRSNLEGRIRVSLDFLCKNSTNLPEVLVHLLSHSLLSQRESEVVEYQVSNYDRFRQLFSFLIPRVSHKDNYQHFVKAFQQSGNEHILEELKSTVVTKDFAPWPPYASFRSIRFNVREPVPSFQGREKFLRDLHQRNLQHFQCHRTATVFATTSTILSRISVVKGLGGIGKTETIRKYIHSYGHCYQHVVWIDAEDHHTAENQFRRLALQELKLPSKDIDNKAKDFDVLLKDIYDRLCTSQTLLVLDNSQALHDTNLKRPGVTRFFPKCLPPTHIKPVVLITSRHQDWPELHSLPLPLLTPQESIAFIFRHLNLKESDSNEKDATTLSETFGGLPLALQAAAAVILQESKRNELMGKGVYSIQHLLRDYSQGQQEVLKKRLPGSPDTQPLMLLWKVSLDKIRQQPHGHLATEILNVMAHLSPTNIPKGFLTFIFSSEDSNSLVDAVALLVDYSFVHNSRTHFSIHCILQDVTLAHLEAPAEENPRKGVSLLLAPPLTRITTALRNYFPTLPKSSEAYDAVHDNLVHVTMSHVLPKLRNPPETDFHFIRFTEFVFNQIIDTRRVEAEKCCRMLITYFTNTVLPSNSASLFESPYFKKVLRLRRELAGILERMGRYKEAVDICQGSLTSFNFLKDQTDVMSEILATKHRLASILGSQGEYQEAIKLYSSVIELLSKLHGPTHPSTLAMKNNLAMALQNCGRLSEAKNHYAEILVVMMKGLGQLHPFTLATKHNIAMILMKESRYDDALEVLTEVAEVRGRVIGPLHADTLITNSCMADVLDDQGKYEEALRLYAHVISSYEKASAASHPDCLMVKNNLAISLGKQGRVDEAKEILCHVLEARERILGPSHIHTLITKHNVAYVLEKQGKQTEALKLYGEVLELRTKHFGPMHPSTLETNSSIGWLQLKMGNFEEKKASR